MENFAARVAWNPDLKSIPEYAFGVAVGSPSLSLSSEHTASEWLDVKTAMARLEWDSNRLALRELHERLSGEPFHAL